MSDAVHLNTIERSLKGLNKQIGGDRKRFRDTYRSLGWDVLLLPQGMQRAQCNKVDKRGETVTVTIEVQCNGEKEIKRVDANIKLGDLCQSGEYLMIESVKRDGWYVLDGSKTIREGLRGIRIIEYPVFVVREDLNGVNVKSAMQTAGFGSDEATTELQKPETLEANPSQDEENTETSDSDSDNGTDDAQEELENKDEHLERIKIIKPISTGFVDSPINEKTDSLKRTNPTPVHSEPKKLCVYESDSD